MVYESDFYTVRRPYSSRVTPTISSYSVSRREVPWDKVPFVPRPSLVPDPITAFGRRKEPLAEKQVLIIRPQPKTQIKPKILVHPPKPYISPREATRNKPLRQPIQNRQFSIIRDSASDFSSTEVEVMDLINGMDRCRLRSASTIPSTVTPRHYSVLDSPYQPRRAEENYSYSYTSNQETRSNDPYRPSTRNYSTSERTSRTAGGPYGNTYTSTSESSRRSGDGPGGYSASYSSTASGRLPGGTSYRHYSYHTVPSQVTKYLPGVGKVYVVNTYPRYITTYTSPKRITYYSPSQIVRVRPSSYLRELDRIENKYRTSNTYSYISDFLNSPSATVYVLRTTPRYIYSYGGSKRISYYTPASIYSNYFTDLNRLEHQLGPYRTHSYLSDFLTYATTFDDEKRAIRAQSNALLQRIHTNVPRVTVRVIPAPYSRYTESPFPIRISSDAYLRSLVQPVRRVADNIRNMSYYSEPAKRFIGPGHLACIRFAGDKAYNQRKHMSDITDQVIRNDINLLSYYLKNRQAAQTGAIEAPIKVTGLSPNRPTRVFSTQKPLPDPADEKREVEALKAANKAKLIEEPQQDASAKLSEKRRKQAEEKEAEERALAEERARQKEEAKKEEEARRAEQERQAELEKQRLLEEEAEREAQRIEKARKDAEERQAAELAAQEEAAALAAAEEAERIEAARLEAERLEAERLAAEQKAEEERLEAERKAEEARLEEERIRQEELAHLAEIAKQAEEAKDAELQRQAEELAEMARQESELAKQQSELQKEDIEEDNAIAEAATAEADEDAGNESADEQAEIEESAEPVVEEPATPEVAEEQSVAKEVEVEEGEEEEEEEEEEE